MLQGTSYGEGEDSKGTCSYGTNMANTNDLPWSNGLTMTVAMNDAQFGSSVSCGMCVTFQGTGTGIGTMPIPGMVPASTSSSNSPHCAVSGFFPHRNKALSVACALV